MRSHYTMYEIPLATALVYLVTLVESKPASIHRVASLFISQCLETAPRIIEPPITGHIELIKFKRQDIGFNTCAFINDKSFTCARSGTCTSLTRGSIDYVGCCYGEGDCDTYTGCYDGEATVGTRTTNPLILSCAGTRPFCATVLLPQELKTAYMCAEQPSTITVDPAADSPTPSSSSEDRTTVPEPTRRAPPHGGSRPITDLTKGQKIGIGAGCSAVGLLFAAGLGYCCCYSRKRRQKGACKNVSENARVTPSEESESKPHVIESR